MSYQSFRVLAISEPAQSACLCLSPQLPLYAYRATRAHKEYKTVLVEARAGINASEEEIKALDDIISPLIENGQSVYTILHNHLEITQCEKTIYNYIDAGVFSVRNMDLPKKVTYKPRQSHGTEIDDTDAFEGRTYKDLQNYLWNIPIQR